MEFDKKVAVIVVNYNGKKFLDDLFESLKITKYPADKWKLVFVDNNSADDSLEYAKEKYPFAHFIENKENLGFTGGNNCGSDWAIENNYDYIFLLNQDTIVTSDWLNILVETMENDLTIACLQPKILLHPEVEKINTAGNKINFLGFGYSTLNGIKDEGQIKYLSDINYCSGAGVLIRVDFIKKVGLFDDEMFFDLEDLDLGWKAQMLGYRNVINPRAIMYHKYKFGGAGKRMYFTERNRFIVFYKNYKTATRILLLPMSIVMEFGILLFALKNKWLKYKIQSYFYFLNPKNWKYLRRAKKKIQSLRTVKDVDIMKKFTPVINFQEIDNPLLKYVGNPIMKLYYWLMILIIKW
ncbi:MAG: glycosyltransferase family 2 protein [Patescibacteria group bacterium]|nr:glycosyltransferase family 2 protein [Patescibacteria group bacterium]MDD4304318.1 glycosyltransferase family 2 protein [Patescibacteria group bacterium]MDD4695581.1 glycosyltransferase family 2 protein [Patescibacteria group bacterium]